MKALWQEGFWCQPLKHWWALVSHPHFTKNLLWTSGYLDAVSQCRFMVGAGALKPEHTWPLFSTRFCVSPTVVEYAVTVSPRHHIPELIHSRGSVHSPPSRLRCFFWSSLFCAFTSEKWPRNNELLNFPFCMHGRETRNDCAADNLSSGLGFCPRARSAALSTCLFSDFWMVLCPDSNLVCVALHCCFKSFALEI